MSQAGQSQARRQGALTESGSKVPTGWATYNLVLVLVELPFAFGFFHGLIWFNMKMAGGAALLMFAAALLVRRPHRTRQIAARGTIPSGAPGAAIALSCFFGALAWTFSVYIAYLALVPVGFAVARFYDELRHRHRTSP